VGRALGCWQLVFSLAAASQSIWPVEPAGSRQDNQLMRIVTFESVIVKRQIKAMLAKSRKITGW
jgi:hypothetical protein